MGLFWTSAHTDAFTSSPRFSAPQSMRRPSVSLIDLDIRKVNAGSAASRRLSLGMIVRQHEAYPSKVRPRVPLHEFSPATSGRVVQVGIPSPQLKLPPRV